MKRPYIDRRAAAVTLVFAMAASSCHRKETKPGGAAENTLSSSAVGAASTEALAKAGPGTDFLQNYTGTVASRPIAAVLLRQGDVLSGSYEYETTKKKEPTLESEQSDLVLTGKIEGDRVTMTETLFTPKDRAHGKETGHFQGTLAADGSLKGTWSNPKNGKSYPFAWSVNEKEGHAGGFAVTTANVRLTSFEPSDTVGRESYRGDLVLLDRRQGYRVYTLEENYNFIQHGAGNATSEMGDEELVQWGSKPEAVAAAYKKVFSEDRVIYSNLITADAGRNYVRVLASFVAEKPNHQLHATVFNLDPSEDIKFENPDIEIAIAP